MGASTGYFGIDKRKQIFSVSRKPKNVDNKVDKGVTEIEELELKKTADRGMRYTLDVV